MLRNVFSQGCSLDPGISNTKLTQNNNKHKKSHIKGQNNQNRQNGTETRQYDNHCIWINFGTFGPSEIILPQT